MEVGTVISASLYSLGCPSLAHRLVDHYAMGPATDKYHLTGVGCASGVPLMRLAAQTLRENPEGQALVVAAESMSGVLSKAATGGPEGEDRRRGDLRRRLRRGAAVRRPALRGPGDPRLRGPPDRGHARRGEDGHGRRGQLSASRARAAGPGRRGPAERRRRFLRNNHLEHSEIDHWIVHPGGRRIIENVQTALELSDEELPRAGRRWPTTATSARRRSCTCSRTRSSATIPSRASAA